MNSYYKKQNGKYQSLGMPVYKPINNTNNNAREMHNVKFISGVSSNVKSKNIGQSWNKKMNVKNGNDQKNRKDKNSRRNSSLNWKKENKSNNALKKWKPRKNKEKNM